VRDVDIARWRLRSQHLVAPHAASAAEVVGSLLAVQAENAGQAGWAVAARTRRPDQADLAKLLDDGAVLRTHVLRPTWHFALPDDIAWMLRLTAPRLRGLMAYYSRQQGLDDAELARSRAVLADAVAGGRHRIRRELADLLEAAGVAAAAYQGRPPARIPPGWPRGDTIMAGT